MSLLNKTLKDRAKVKMKVAQQLRWDISLIGWNVMKSRLGSKD